MALNRCVRSCQSNSQLLFSVLSSPSDAQNRSGITNFGARNCWAPTSKSPNFSVRSEFWFSVGSDLDGVSWWTQFLNDYCSLFTEVDFFIEDIDFKLCLLVTREF